MYVASDLVCTVCLWPFYRFPGKNGLIEREYNVCLADRDSGMIAFEYPKLTFKANNISLIIR